ncbi:Mov34/MPN/PAD-1 family protein [Paenibacillus sp. YN15]|uniref:Mov34/MPN/PAD-1 family protein n=1 Tax=Paenibacillus sp. YN15 TaxID=1742774 RepID=UPI000DCEC133|nr:M67 family metallopeptidase [Paenibacillus sp. YN15]RAU99857.1 hypothetical protein DQG13_15280 [Paenibacillus sp. YN15]
MKLFFSEPLFRDHSRPDSLAAACREALPHECCGILTGRSGPGFLHVDGFVLLRNAASHPEAAFSFDPAEWVEVLYHYGNAANPEQMVGIFHSHPEAPAIPSAADMDTLWDTPLHLIVSLRHNKTPELRCYLPRRGRSWEEQAIRYHSG